MHWRRLYSIASLDLRNETYGTHHAIIMPSFAKYLGHILNDNLRDDDIHREVKNMSTLARQPCLRAHVEFDVRT